MARGCQVNGSRTASCLESITSRYRITVTGRGKILHSRLGRTFFLLASAHACGSGALSAPQLLGSGWRGSRRGGCRRSGPKDRGENSWGDWRQDVLGGSARGRHCRPTCSLPWDPGFSTGASSSGKQLHRYTDPTSRSCLCQRSAFTVFQVLCFNI